MEVFVDDITVHEPSLMACLENLQKVLNKCIEKGLVLKR